MLLYAVTVFVSAFLLFAVQPVIAKAILPWFGGSSAVWSTCMLFFQAVLVLGYGYAHWLNRKLTPRRQALVHTVILTASLTALPVLPAAHWKAASAWQPSFRILALLSVTVGLPYLLLSSTGPLVQAWYARRFRQAVPYRLFALSNLASMLALLSYPLLVEPHLATHTQALVWSGAYVVFAACCAAAAWKSPRDAPAFAPSTASAPAPPWSVRLLWLGLAAAASILLLSVTNYLTQDVAPIPFLWILPLSVYLLSFILVFDSPAFYRRAVFVPLFVAALAYVAGRLWWKIPAAGVRPGIALVAFALFVWCMVCHGELARLKPHPRYLTGFYVTISLGGALGGAFVGLAAPNLFGAFYEFPLGLAFCAVVALIAFARSWLRLPRLWRFAALAASCAVLGGYLWCLAQVVRQMSEGYRVVARNFYGQLRVADDGDPRYEEMATRELIHGTINHGVQMLSEEYRRVPVSYFCPESGIGRAMQALKGPRRVGILGLGCGTLAAYGRRGDTFRIYEINPLVLHLAQTEFTYLRDSEANLEFALGDGRLSLEAEPQQRFDLLVMDAFSGDSVPVHLLTREAFAVYFARLKPDGIVAVNTTNSYLNLEPVMRRAAEAFGKVALLYEYEPGDMQFRCFHCKWTLMMSPATAAAHPELEPGARALQNPPDFRIWTDDFSNLYSILK